MKPLAGTFGVKLVRKGQIVRSPAPRVHVEPCLADGEGKASCAGRPMRKNVSWCGTDGCTGPRTCQQCRNAYVRAWRAKGREKTPEAKKVRARALIKMRVRRGKLTPMPCAKCGNPEVEAHHPDYDKPDKVVWLCTPCHKAHHRVITTSSSKP